MGAISLLKVGALLSTVAPTPIDDVPPTETAIPIETKAATNLAFFISSSFLQEARGQNANRPQDLGHQIIFDDKTQAMKSCPSCLLVGVGVGSMDHELGGLDGFARI
jgi:hypothetical protein